MNRELYRAKVFILCGRPTDMLGFQKNKSSVFVSHFSDSNLSRTLSSSFVHLDGFQHVDK